MMATRHGMLSTLLALYEGIHWLPVDSPNERSEMQNVDVFFIVSLNMLPVTQRVPLLAIRYIMTLMW